jgi:hypothetical protein
VRSKAQSKRHPPTVYKRCAMSLKVNRLSRRLGATAALCITACVELYLPGGRFADAYWAPGTTETAGACVTLRSDVTPGSPAVQFTMKVIAENQVTLSYQGDSVFTYQLNFGMGNDPDWILALGDREPTVFLVKNYDAGAKTLKLWDPTTNLVCASKQLFDGTPVVALVPDSAGYTFSITYDTTGTGPTSGSAYTLILDGDDERLPQANGKTPHTIVATIEQKSTAVKNFTVPAIFSLPDSQSAVFLAQAGQSASEDQKKLTAPFDPATGKATAQFVDTSARGETVALRAEADMDPQYVLSTPESLPMVFTQDMGVTVSMTPGTTNLLHRAVATAGVKNAGVLPASAQTLIFTVPSSAGVIFVAKQGQSLDLGATKLTAPLNGGTTASAELYAMGKGALFPVTAVIDNQSVYVPASPPYLIFAIDATLKLAGDNITKTVTADGATEHMAEATVLGTLVDKPDSPYVVTFKLPPKQSAKFVPRKGQKLGNDGKDERTLLAPLDPGTQSAKAYFMDTDVAGETVTLTAEIIDNGLDLTSSPPSLNFPFAALTLLLGPTSSSPVPADGISTHTATASLPSAARDVGKWNVTFQLPTDKHATFQKQANQIVSADGKTLTAPLDATTHAAQAEFTDAQIVGGESVDLTASIKGQGLVSTPASVAFGFAGLQLALGNDTQEYVPADGVATHAVTATLTGPGIESYPWSVVFTVSGNSATFKVQPGQTLGKGGKTLTAPLTNNIAQALVIDNDYVHGETVTVAAVINNDVVTLPSTPTSRKLEFGALVLDLQSKDEDEVIKADGKSTHSANVTLSVKAGDKLTSYKNVTWNVTFDLPTSKRATFQSQTGAQLTNGGKTLIVPLSKNAAAASFVDNADETVDLTATVTSDDSSINLSSTPATMSFSFGAQTYKMGTVDHPKRFKEDSAEVGDVFQLLDGDCSGTGYITGAFYIAQMPVAANSLATSPPPPVGATDSNGCWKHAWQKCASPALYPQDYANSNDTHVYLYANGRHCVGLTMSFDPQDGNNQSLVPSASTLASYRRFQSYMTKVIPLLSPALIKSDGTKLSGGWGSTLTPTAYTTYLNPSTQVEGDRLEGRHRADTGEAAIGAQQITVYLTTTDVGRLMVGGTFTLPDGATVVSYGTAETADTSPIPARSYTSNSYKALSGIAVSPYSAQRTGAFGDATNDLYCLNNADTNTLTPEFYWRQDNYLISIDNSVAPINKFGEDKKIADYYIFSAGVDYRDDTQTWYHTSSNNYYNTDAYLFPSTATDATADIWSDYYQSKTPLTDLGNMKGVLTIVLITKVTARYPFMQRPYWSDCRPQGVKFHDQYGNDGSFYFNYNFPKNYYPEGYDPNAQDSGIPPNSISIKPVIQPGTRTVLSSFSNIIVDSGVSADISLQTYAYWYTPDQNKWAVIDPLSAIFNGYYKTVVMSPKGGAAWRFGAALNVPTGEIAPNKYFGLYVSPWDNPGTSIWGISQAMGDQYGNDMTVWADAYAGEYIQLRPIWTTNGFRLWHNGAGGPLGGNYYFYPDSGHQAMFDSVFLEYAIGGAPPPGATWATFKFVHDAQSTS